MAAQIAMLPWEFAQAHFLNGSRNSSSSPVRSDFSRRRQARKDLRD